MTNRERMLAILEPLTRDRLPTDLRLLLWYELAWCHRAKGADDRAAAAYDELIRTAVKDRFIDDPDHTVLRTLRGEV